MAKPSRIMPLGNPADYPLGSPESRAAARAMLEATPLTEEERSNLTPEQRAERLKKIFQTALRRSELGYKPEPITDPAHLKRINQVREIFALVFSAREKEGGKLQ